MIDEHISCNESKLRAILGSYTMYNKGKLSFEVVDNLAGYEAKATILGYKTQRRNCGYGDEDGTILIVDKDNIDVTVVTEKPLSVLGDGLFACTGFREIDVSNLLLITSLCTAECMFQHCTHLERVVFGKHDLSKIASIDNMFNGCMRLREIDASEVKIPDLWHINGIFNGCTRLNKVLVNKKQWIKLRDITGAFSYCGLEEVDLSWLSLDKCKTLRDGFMLSYAKKIILPPMPIKRVLSLFTCKANIFNTLEVLGVWCDISKIINSSPIPLQSKVFKKLEVYNLDRTIAKTYTNVSKYPEVIRLVLDEDENKGDTEERNSD